MTTSNASRTRRSMQDADNKQDEIAAIILVEDHRIGAQGGRGGVEEDEVGGEDEAGDSSWHHHVTFFPMACKINN